MKISHEKFAVEVQDFRAHLQTVINTRRPGGSAIEKQITSDHFEYTLIGVCPYRGCPESLTGIIKWEEGVVSWFVKDGNGTEVAYDRNSVPSTCEAMNNVQ